MRDDVVGVMTMEVKGKNSQARHRLVDAAVAAFDRMLDAGNGLRVELLNFDAPHLTPTAGAQAPLDFLRIGLTEKLERNVDFLLVVTEVDLSTSTLACALVLPSQLTNIGIVSAKRLDPRFRGDRADENCMRQRLARLLHTFGHLLILPHHDDPTNVMHGFSGVDDLDAMVRLTPAQRGFMCASLPREALERTSVGSRWRFALSMLAADWRSIAHAVARANPLRLAGRLPTLITAALSVIIVLFSSPEMWEVTSTVELDQLLLFSVAAIMVATVVLYRAFAFGIVLRRGRWLAESTVVAGAATLLCRVFTLVFLYAAFAAIAHLGIVTIVPHKRMITWSTVDPAMRTIDHVKLSLFVAALGIRAGSLGGSADRPNRPDRVRRVLFIDEET